MRSSKHNQYGCQRAYAMVLVLVAMATAIMASGAYLMRSSVASTRAGVLGDYARARLEAESTLEGFIGSLRRDPGLIDPLKDSAILERSPDVGVLATLTSTPDVQAPSIEVAVQDPSFETLTGMMDRPLVSPPMSETMGPWDISRSGGLTNILGLVLGATVPDVGVEASARATDGSNYLRITFLLSVAGSAEVSQTLDHQLVPMSRYRFSFDAGNATVLELLADFGARVRVGTTVLTDVPCPELITLLDLGGGIKRYCLEFDVLGSPPAGDVTIEFYATSLVGLLSSVAFDNIECHRGPLPRVAVEVTGMAGTSSHRINATLEAREDGGETDYVVVDWTEGGS